MRYFQFRLKSSKEPATLQVEAQELKQAIKIMAGLVKYPGFWYAENETTIMTINSKGKRITQ